MTVWVKDEIVQALEQVRVRVTAAVEGASVGIFERTIGASWSASGYLKHLILSVKPTARAFQLPENKLGEMFGVADHPSRSYDEVVAMYSARLAEGVRAEDMPPVLPVSYRMPEGVTDEKAHLIEAWNTGCLRLIEALTSISETALDTYQLPHPAAGLLTLREMLFFTIHHNTMHAGDIERSLASAVGAN